MHQYSPNIFYQSNNLWPAIYTSLSSIEPKVQGSYRPLIISTQTPNCWLYGCKAGHNSFSRNSSTCCSQSPISFPEYSHCSDLSLCPWPVQRMGLLRSSRPNPPAHHPHVCGAPPKRSYGSLHVLPKNANSWFYLFWKKRNANRSIFISFNTVNGLFFGSAPLKWLLPRRLKNTVTTSFTCRLKPCNVIWMSTGSKIRNGSSLVTLAATFSLIRRRPSRMFCKVDSIVSAVRKPSGMIIRLQRKQLHSKRSSAQRAHRIHVGKEPPIRQRKSNFGQHDNSGQNLTETEWKAMRQNKRTNQRSSFFLASLSEHF